IKSYDIDCKILEAVITSNKKRPKSMVDKISTLLDRDLKDKHIAILGLTYKAGTDDIRASPAIEIIKILLDKGGYVKAFDPIGLENAKKNFENKNLLYLDSVVEACKLTNVIVIATEWLEFKELNWQEIYNLVKSPIIIDLRNILDSEAMKKIGFRYYTVGSKI
ncbi:MAG: UDP binding domain-containing protein, partial [Rickettsia sp.]